MGDEYQIGGILGDPPFDDEGDEPMTDADLPSDEELVAVANRAYREVASAGANVSGASRAGRLAVARLAQQRERERGEAKLIAALAPLGVSMMDPPDGGDVSLYEQVERCVAEIARLNGQLAELRGALSNEHANDVLSQPCFAFIRLAQLWRDTGTDIPRKAEQEQAFFLAAQLRYAIDHGAEWRQRFYDDEIAPRLERARAALSTKAGGA
jgi:hypothetical protein